LFYQPAADPLAENQASFRFWNMEEHVSRILLMAVLIGVVQPNAQRRHSRVMGMAALAALALYYGCWICYFLGIAPAALFLGLAVFPILFFAAAAFWLPNRLALAPLAVFGAVHIAVTASNFLFS
ncbi:MAG: hypothetical protein LIO46_01735, partial [Clostridiales bacterium]|nr:hypothetical protein [Clostridiales bacterium]